MYTPPSFPSSRAKPSRELSTSFLVIATRRALSENVHGRPPVAPVSTFVSTFSMPVCPPPISPPTIALAFEGTPRIRDCFVLYRRSCIRACFSSNDSVFTRRLRPLTLASAPPPTIALAFDGTPSNDDCFVLYFRILSGEPPFCTRRRLSSLSASTPTAICSSPALLLVPSPPPPPLSEAQMLLLTAAASAVVDRRC